MKAKPIKNPRLGWLAVFAAGCLIGGTAFPLACIAQDSDDDEAAAGAGKPVAGLRSDPTSWIPWRAAPIPFPDRIEPQVPEMLAGPPKIDFGKNGANLTIIMPDDPGADYDGKALIWAKNAVLNKARNAKVVTATQALQNPPATQVLVLGTLQNNAFAANLLAVGASLATPAIGKPALKQGVASDAPTQGTENTAPYFVGINPGGYRIETINNPAAPAKKIILALGADPKGAWASGMVLVHSMHPDKADLNMLDNWPVTIPKGAYWLPFSARSSPPAADFERTGPPNPAPPPPKVPFGPRIWGSPMPTLASYQRLMRALKPSGINTVVVQSGGWVDLPDAPEVFAKAVEIAWQEGIYTILYIGNDLRSHYSAPLTENHKNVVLATKGLPGLLAFHLYNQLGAKGMTPADYADLRQQIKWVKSVTAKPLVMEIVWGHRQAAIPDEKIKLMADLKSWGVDVIATDFAPIGGWADGYIPRWEQKLVELGHIEPKPEAVLQAHVPFLKAAVPTREQVRNQFWWALSGGARAFYFEAAYLHTHFSMRGLLSWDFRPLPDGRFDEMKRLAALIPNLTDLTTNSTIATKSQLSSSGFSLVNAPVKTHLRLRTAGAGKDVYYILIINEDLNNKTEARLAMNRPNSAYAVTDILTGAKRGELKTNQPMQFEIAPGDAACLRLESAKTGQ